MSDGTQVKTYGWENEPFRYCSVRWARASLLDDLAEMAKAKGMTRNLLINQIVETAVEKWRRKNDRP